MSVSSRVRAEVSSVLALFLAAMGLPAFAEEVHRFDIDASQGALAIQQFGTQSGVQILAAAERLKGKRLNAVSGDLSTDEALARLLEGSGIKHEYIGDRAVALLPEQQRRRLAQATGENAAPRDAVEEIEPTIKGIPEILVTGSKLLNMDIERTADDTQPYVIFNRETIERSGAQDLEGFLKQRLTMNSSAQSSTQVGTFISGNTSAINLRGLGANQTLILVDGRRRAGALTGLYTPMQQSDLNGIPMAAVERIEILPATASGIYGGGATGGVVNVIMRRDYSGAEVRMNYENTFDSDAAIRGIDLAAGFNLEGGRTHVLAAASYSDRNPLFVGERDLVQRFRHRLLDNVGGDPYTMGGSFPLIGATTNIRSTNGSPLFGPGTSNVTFVPEGYAGGGGLTPLQANAGQFNLAPPNTAQSSLGAGQGNRSSYGGVPTVESLSATIRREFTPSIDVFLDVAASNNSTQSWTNTTGLTGFTIAATAPNNPFGQAIQVGVPITAGDAITSASSSTRNATAGMLFELPGEWRGGVDYSWSRSRFSATQGGGLSSAATAAVANGTLDVLRDPSLIDFSAFVTRPTRSPPYYATLNNVALRLSGPLFTLPAGPVVLSALAEHRDEQISDGYQIGTTTGAFSPHRSQYLTGIYLEVRAPLTQSLELQLAARYDDYVLNGANVLLVPIEQLFNAGPVIRARTEQSSVNPTVGLKFQPLEDVTLRASYGTGFLPPSLNQLAANSPSIQNSPSSLLDPLRGATPLTAPISLVSGGNSNLDPEKSESWSAGVVLKPRFAPHLRASIDYIRLRKSDNIVELSSQRVIDNEAVLPGRVVRGPNLPGDPAGWAGPIVTIDQSAVNISRAWLEAWDFAFDYSYELGAFGALDLYSVATYQPHYRTQVAPSLPEVENAGVGGSTSSIPLKLKVNSGINWHSGQWSAGWNSRYFDKYLVASPTLTTAETVYRRQGARYVPRQIYHDAYVGYEFDAAMTGALSMLHGMELQLGVKNVLNTRPKYDINNSTNLYSGFGDPRLASYYLTVTRAF